MMKLILFLFCFSVLVTNEYCHDLTTDRADHAYGPGYHEDQSSADSDDVHMTERSVSSNDEASTTANSLTAEPLTDEPLPVESQINDEVDTTEQHLTSSAASHESATVKTIILNLSRNNEQDDSVADQQSENQTNSLADEGSGNQTNGTTKIGGDPRDNLSVVDEEETVTVETVTRSSPSTTTETTTVTTTTPEPVYPITYVTITSGLTKIRLNHSFEMIAEADGSHVSFYWNFGDESSYTGSTVSHAYQSLGRFSITVIANNSKSSKSARQDIDVDDKIHNVTVTSNAAVYKICEPIHLTAVPYPNSYTNVDIYEWRLEDCVNTGASSGATITCDKIVESVHAKPTRPMTTQLHKFSYYDKRPGMCKVYVKARNSYGEVTSCPPLTVHVMAEITEVSIKIISEETLSNQVITFLIEHFYGTDATYYWDFGDGTPPLITKIVAVNHTYTSAGEYMVVANATNAVSSQSVSQSIFILDKICKVPIITFLGQKNPKFYRSMAIRVEAKVAINCSITNKSTYEWMLYRTNITQDVKTSDLSNSTLIDMNELNMMQVKDPVLCIPARSLQYGQYCVQLKVSMEGTIVYGMPDQPHCFGVTPGKLIANIRGGVQRTVSRTRTVLLKAAYCSDPDHSDGTDNVMFNWTCSDYEQNSKNCFEEEHAEKANQKLKTNSARIAIPGSWFNQNSRKFIITLTIGKVNRSNAHAVQLLDMKNSSVIDVHLNCSQCLNEIVNANENLTIGAFVSAKYRDSAQYNWTLSTVQNATQRSQRIDTTKKICSKLTDDPSTKTVTAAADVAKTTPTVITTTPAPTTVTVKDSRCDGLSTTTTATTTTTSPESQEVVTTDTSEVEITSTLNPTPSTGRPDMPGPPIGGGSFFNPDEGGGSSGRRKAGTARISGPSLHEGGMPSGRQQQQQQASSDYASNENGKKYPSSSSSGQAIKPGLDSRPIQIDPIESSRPNTRNLGQLGGPVISPGEGGSSGRQQPTFNPEHSIPKAEEDAQTGGRGDRFPSEKAGPSGRIAKNKTSPAHDDMFPNIANSTWFDLRRYQYNVEGGDTTVRKSGRELVINENVLIQGMMYVVSLTVTHPQYNESGYTEIFFRVNENPSRGKCVLDERVKPGMKKSGNLGGTEMLTEYSVYCMGWKDMDQNSVLSYEVSYTLIDNDPPTLIYDGYDNEVYFQLPATNQFNKPVRVDIVISDGLGGKTSVCANDLPIQKTSDNDRTMLAHLWCKTRTDLVYMLERGDNRNARLLMRMIALQLNRHSCTKDVARSDKKPGSLRFEKDCSRYSFKRLKRKSRGHRKLKDEHSFIESDETKRNSSRRRNRGRRSRHGHEVRDFMKDYEPSEASSDRNDWERRGRHHDSSDHERGNFHFRDENNRQNIRDFSRNRTGISNHNTTLTFTNLFIHDRDNGNFSKENPDDLDINMSTGGRNQGNNRNMNNTDNRNDNGRHGSFIDNNRNVNNTDHSGDRHSFIDNTSTGGGISGGSGDVNFHGMGSKSKVYSCESLEGQSVYISDDLDFDNERLALRLTLLSVLKDLPLRDVLEVQQTLSTLMAITAIGEELNATSVTYAGQVALNASKEAVKLLRRYENNVVYGLSRLSMESMSNVLYGGNKSFTPYPPTQSPPPPRSTRGNSSNAGNTIKLVKSSIDVIDSLLQTKLNQLATLDGTVSQTTEDLSAFALRNNSMVDVSYAGTRFTIPIQALKYSRSSNGGTGSKSVVKSAAGSKQPLLFSSASNMSASDDGTDDDESDDDEEEECYQANLVTFKDNPYLPQQYTVSSDDQISVDEALAPLTVVSLSLLSCNGTPIKVSNLSEDEGLIDIIIAQEQLNDQDQEYHDLERKDMHVHVFNISADQSDLVVHVDIELLAGTPDLRLFPLMVLFRSGAPPTLTEYDRKWNFPSSQESINLILDSDSMNSTSQFIGVLDATYNSGKQRPDQSTSRGYRVKIWSGRCVYWNDTRQEWLGDGCFLDPKSTYVEYRCRCNHLTSFSSRLSVASSSLLLINLEQFFITMLNPSVPVSVAAMFLIYAVLLLFVVKLDLHDVIKLRPVPLIDNSKSDRQKYAVTLETGFGTVAGTTAKVSVVLHGEYGMSETRELLSQDGQPLFERNSRDTFYLTFAESLGPIFKVQLWHNNAGSSPSWYLNRVAVYDISADETYYFVCEKWFAVEKEDGKVEREMMVTEKGLDFRKVLKSKSTQYATDYHLWLSAFIRPSYSRFTRAQRLTCLLALVMTYSAISALWYSKQYVEYRGEFNFIDISWKSIIVGILISLVALVPNLIIALMFRLCKARQKSSSSKPVVDKKEEEQLNSQQTNSDSNSTGRGQQRSGWSATTSVFDQTLIGWLMLQEWAQRTWAKQFHQSPVGGSTQSVDIQHIGTLSTYGRMGGIGSDETGRGEGTEKYQSDCSSYTSSHSRPATKQCDIEMIEMQSSPSGTCEDKLPITTTTVVNEHCVGSGGNQDEVVDVNKYKDQEESCRRHSNKESLTSSYSEDSYRKDSDISRKGKPTLAESKMSANDTSRMKSGGHSAGDVAENSSSGTQHPLQPPSYGNINNNGTSRLRYGSDRSRSNKSVTRSQTSKVQSLLDKKSQKRVLLPWWCVYMAWIFCWLVIASCAALTLYFGLRFSRTQSVLWLQTVFFSILNCCFITHPIIVLVTSLYAAVKYENDISIFDHYDYGLPGAGPFNPKPLDTDLYCEETLKAAEENEEGEISPEKDIADRQRSRYLRFARPPQEQKLIEARHKTMKETNAAALISEAALFVIQFVLLMFIAFGKNLQTEYQLNSALTKSLVSYGHPLPFSNISSVSEWWDWSSEHLINKLYNQDPHMQGYVEQSVLIGSANLRQLRVLDQPCSVTTDKPMSRCRRVQNPLPEETRHKHPSTTRPPPVQRTTSSKPAGLRRKRADTQLKFESKEMENDFVAEENPTSDQQLKFRSAAHSSVKRSDAKQFIQSNQQRNSNEAKLSNDPVTTDGRFRRHNERGLDRRIENSNVMRYNNERKYPEIGINRKVEDNVQGKDDRTRSHGNIHEYHNTKKFNNELDSRRVRSDINTEVITMKKIDNDDDDENDDDYEDDDDYDDLRRSRQFGGVWGKRRKSLDERNYYRDRDFARDQDARDRDFTRDYRSRRSDSYVDDIRRDRRTLYDSYNRRSRYSHRDEEGSWGRAPQQYPLGSCVPSDTCLPFYSEAVQDTSVFSKSRRSYWYLNSSDTRAADMKGTFGYYGGGGYLQSLSNNRSETEDLLKMLRSDEWIDNYTSAVLLDLTLFHPPSNLFTSVTLLMELPPLGMAFTSWRINSAHLYRYISVMDKWILVCELLFFLATFFKVHREANRVIKYGLDYVKDVWNVLELSQCLLSLTFIICYTYRFLLVDAAVENMRSRYYEVFVDVSVVADWDQILKNIIGFILLLVGLQLLKTLRHHQPFAKYANIYSHAALDIVVFGCLTCIWMGGFVSLGLAVFSNTMSEFHSLGSSISSTSNLLTGSYRFDTRHMTSFSDVISWHLYALSFYVMAVSSIIAYIIAVLTFYYKVFKEEPKLLFTPSQNISFLLNRVRGMFTFMSCNKTSDERNNEKDQDSSHMPPEFTMAEILYQVDEMLFKMNALSGTSNLPEKPHQYFTDSDMTYGGSSGAESEVRGTNNIDAVAQLVTQQRQEEKRNAGVALSGEKTVLRDERGMRGGKDQKTRTTHTDEDVQAQLIRKLELETLRRLQASRKEAESKESELQRSIIPALIHEDVSKDETKDETLGDKILTSRDHSPLIRGGNSSTCSSNNSSSKSFNQQDSCTGGRRFPITLNSARGNFDSSSFSSTDSRAGAAAVKHSRSPFDVRSRRNKWSESGQSAAANQSRDPPGGQSGGSSDSHEYAGGSSDCHGDISCSSHESETTYKSKPSRVNLDASNAEQGKDDQNLDNCKDLGKDNANKSLDNVELEELDKNTVQECLHNFGYSADDDLNVVDKYVNKDNETTHL